MKKSRELAIKSTQAFYYGILGFSSDISFIIELLDVSAEAQNIVDEIYFFKMMESDNPLTILGNAYANSVKYSDIDTIIALSNGGTQSGIVTHMFMRMLENPCDLHIVPSSNQQDNVDMDEIHNLSLDKLIDEITILGKNILITQDNNNSITKNITDLIQQRNPNKINISLMEMYPYPLNAKSKQEKSSNILLGEYMDVSCHDFETATDTVPITKAVLPGRDIRKIIAQRVVFKDLNILTNSKTPLFYIQYIEIPDTSEYRKFRETYGYTHKAITHIYGYRSPIMVAQAMLKKLNFDLYNQYKNTDTERGLISSIATSAVTYPYIPIELIQKLKAQQTTPKYEYKSCYPWMIQGVHALLEEIFKSIAQKNGILYIWTKGDNQRYSYEPLPGAYEQELRFEISGLKSLVLELKTKYCVSNSSFKFLALPDKQRLIKEIVIPDAHKLGANIFMVEDTLENIVKSEQMVEFSNIKFDSFLINRDSKADSLTDCTQKISSRNSMPTLYVLDMDDTLLHEDFRRENQPINMFLRMKEIGLI